MGTQLYIYKPETITRTLRNLRAQIIRDGGPGLEHVEALLQLRGDNLGPVPRKANPSFRRGKLRVAIFTVLRGGPCTGRQVVDHVCEAHGLAYDVMYRSVYAQLGQMKKAGQIRHEGRLWCTQDAVAMNPRAATDGLQNHSRPRHKEDRKRG